MDRGDVLWNGSRFIYLPSETNIPFSSPSGYLHVLVIRSVRTVGCRTLATSVPLLWYRIVLYKAAKSGEGYEI